MFTFVFLPFSHHHNPCRGSVSPVKYYGGQFGVAPLVALPLPVASLPLLAGWSGRSVCVRPLGGGGGRPVLAPPALGAVGSVLGAAADYWGVVVLGVCPASVLGLLFGSLRLSAAVCPMSAQCPLR